jgi:pimeloyl-ACP methyl ester carboxylesterase
MTKVLYISGRGGDHTKGLGGYISTIVSSFSGVSVSVPFLRQDLDDQLAEIRQAINDHGVGTLIANSYGAYLSLLSLIDFDHQLEQVVLLSPVLGKAMAKDRMYFSRPPAAARLAKAVKERRISLPERTAIFIGTDDELYDPPLLTTFTDIIGERNVYLLEGQGHNLDKDVMQKILKAHLGS